MCLLYHIYHLLGHLTQPESVVSGFTTRKKDIRLNSDKKNTNIFGYGKHLSRVGPALRLRTHDTSSASSHASHDSYLSDGSPIISRTIQGVIQGVIQDANQSSVLLMPLQLNHYTFQSREYFKVVKCMTFLYDFLYV
jgi:hypothetical protein